MCLTHRRDAEQSIRQCTEFGAAAALVGTKTLNKLNGFSEQCTAQIPVCGALEVVTGSTQDVGTEQAGASSGQSPSQSHSPRALSNHPKMQCQVALGVQFPWELEDKQPQCKAISALPLDLALFAGECPLSHLPLALPIHSGSRRMEQNLSGSDLFVNTALTPPHFNTALLVLCWRFCSGGF